MEPSWTDWQVVNAAFTEGSFTAAASALGVGQATVSRRVAQVEEQLGHVLFDRHRQGLVPTEAALRLRPHLEALATAAHGAARAIEGLETEARGEVRIAGPPGLCVDLMPQLASRLAKRHPDICLVVLADIGAADLDRREADLALRLMPTTRGDLLVRTLATFRGGLYAAQSYLDGLPEAPALSDLAMVDYSDSLSHIPMAQLIGSFGAKTALRSNNYLVQRAAVQAGVGVGLMGDLEARALGLQPVPVAIPELPAAPLFLVVHRALRHVPRVAAVVEVIEEIVSELKTQL